jgi:predicted RNA-binding protein (virulence factor B family)
VDVQEVKKLDAYLKKLFGNQRLRVVPKKADEADVFVGEERVGGLTVDDEDEERSYNLEIKITLGEAANIKNLKTLEAYLRRKFDTELIRVVARQRKTDSAEVYIGQEYIGVLFFDEKETRSCYFEMAILALDLEEAGIGRSSSI